MLQTFLLQYARCNRIVSFCLKIIPRNFIDIIFSYKLYRRHSTANYSSALASIWGWYLVKILFYCFRLYRDPSLHLKLPPHFWGRCSYPFVIVHVFQWRCITWPHRLPRSLHTWMHIRLLQVRPLTFNAIYWVVASLSIHANECALNS